MSEIENGGNEDIIQEISPNGRFIRYEEVVGRGLIKVAYKGFDQEHGNDVVWYQIQEDDDDNNNNAGDAVREKYSLLLEGELLKTLKHDNIIKCHSLWVDDANKNVNLITELFNAGNLKQYRNKHKSVDLKAMKNWGKQILKGLHYLHSHDPPIVHRDLKCDNIFINGNHGKLKIGNFGMAAKLCDGKVNGVLGTPEFMAPEIYNGEYNELVDIYAFGMCMLEIVACEYPYSECRNQAHIYKKVMTGLKPLALGKVKDPQIKILIEKCLAPSSQRITAAELLQDPIFSSVTPPPIPSNVTSPDFTLESSTDTVDIHFNLKGKRVDEKTILFNLRTKGIHVVNSFEFNFDVEGDNALTVACELVEVNDLMIHDLPHVVELMDNMLLKLQPGWKPSFVDRIEANNGGELGCKKEVCFYLPSRENGVVIINRVD